MNSPQKKAIDILFNIKETGITNKKRWKLVKPLTKIIKKITNTLEQGDIVKIKKYNSTGTITYAYHKNHCQVTFIDKKSKTKYINMYIEKKELKLKFWS